MHLELEIVTPRGEAYSARDIDRVTLRRIEPRFEQGSELVVLPRHGQMMVRLPFHTVRVRAGSTEIGVEIDGGFAEVHNDVVTILTPEARVGTPHRIGCAPTQ